METKKKTKKPAKKPVIKPYLKGRMLDKNTLKSALAFLGSLVVLAVANLFLGAVLLWENTVLRVGINLLMELGILALFFQSGAGRGAGAVNQGEILLQRREAGHRVNDDDAAACFHPLKGYMSGLIGTLPLLICALLLAAVAHRQMTGLGALPGWTQLMERRAEIGGGLAFYHAVTPMGLEDVLRMTVRMEIMPIVNMIGTSNPDALLTLERLSGLLVLLPAAAYGAGYQQGVMVRSRVHTDIAANKRKRARREKKQQARAHKGPEQLN